ncbi:TPA: helix-turn-helix transcriptional regulator [Streptococcus suis]|nr:helix-turn-helix transcriptional regulator [Streptococcus suis]HEL1697015.1 helix-turn-helix transcriptional regulator [Streptococcus suis]HEM2777339.1 helix-turn-helix transcriptional regulator [Streptococcus suis]HEM2827506.1 helix-turn-helix transcriptional regulator [Streptococcus suis]HEM4256055.1 helix-turn-helix transcriptional regulator [Streptococcus suis]
MNKLKLLRKERNLKQSEIAEFMKVNAKTISRWEKGDFEIKPAQAKMLAEFFNVSESYLLGYSSEPNVNFSPVKELKDDNDKVQKGKKIFQDYKGEEAVKKFENDVLLWYTEKYGEADNEGPTPAFFADNFKNQVYFTLAESQTFNNYISLLLTDFFSLPYNDWDRIALMIASYSEKLNKTDED